MITIDELRAELSEAGGPPGAPDLAAITGRGRRLRRRRRVMRVGAAAVVVAVVVVGVGVLVGSPGGGSDGDLYAAETWSPPQRLTERARQILDTNPDARQAEGSVILPGDYELARIVPPGVVEGEVVAMGPHHFSPYGPPVAGDDTYPAPQDRVFTDQGPQYLFCALYPEEDPDQCMPTVGYKLPNTGALVGSMGYGTGRFLDEGSEMEVFFGDSFDGDGMATQQVIGGLDGTETSRVVLDLEDGSQVDAQLTHDAVPGDTVWWAFVRQGVANVTAFDADGDVVDEHPIKPCTGTGSECEVY
ncbi:MAG: hypothetical protein GEU96_22355 [Propionibacteriales bacterium]|nr:hypothetical protein [Propionibacteriales bacterium]